MMVTGQAMAFILNIFAIFLYLFPLDNIIVRVNSFETDATCTQEALDLAISQLIERGGGTVILKRKGVYRIHIDREHYYQLPSNTVIDGNNSTIIVEKGCNTDTFTWDSVFYTQDQSNITIKDLSLDCNCDPVIERFSYNEGPMRHNGLYSGLRSKNITIKNCHVTNCKGYGCIHCSYCNNVTILDCSFHNNGVEHSTEFIGDHSVIMGVGDNWLVKGNHISNDYLSNCGTGLDINFANSRVVGNYVESCWAGANVSNNGKNHSHNVLFESNTLVNNLVGIYFWSTTSPYTGDNYNNIVKNNNISWDAKPLTICRGIDLSFFVYGSVRDIILDSNHFSSNITDASILGNSTESAILLGPAQNTYSGLRNDDGILNNITVTNNEFCMITGPAVAIRRHVSNVNINNNVIEDVNITSSRYSTQSVISVVNNLAGDEGTTHNVVVSNNTIRNKYYSIRNKGLHIFGDVGNIKFIDNKLLTGTNEKVSCMLRENIDNKTIVIK